MNIFKKKAKNMTLDEQIAEKRATLQGIYKQMEGGLEKKQDTDTSFEIRNQQEKLEESLKKLELLALDEKIRAYQRVLSLLRIK